MPSKKNTPMTAILHNRLQSTENMNSPQRAVYVHEQAAITNAVHRMRDKYQAIEDPDGLRGRH